MVDRLRRAIAMMGALGVALTPFRPDPARAAGSTAWDFTFDSIEGGTLPLAAWRGQPLRVNVVGPLVPGPGHGQAKPPAPQPGIGLEVRRFLVKS